MQSNKRKAQRDMVSPYGFLDPGGANKRREGRKRKKEKRLVRVLPDDSGNDQKPL